MRTKRTDTLILIAGILALLLALNSMAATTATLVLRGTVNTKVSIDVTPEPLALNLPITITQTNFKVATVTTRSNSAGGYKVTISSLRLGNLTRVGGTETIPYTMMFGGSAVMLTSPTEFNFPFVNASAINRDLTISYTGVTEEDYVAGNYEDSITLTITAN